VSGAADDPLAEQYGAYPYPSRDPAEEKRRLIRGSPSDLWEMVHYLRRGRFDPAVPFRALVAGGGTGDAAIMLAQQLADAGAGRAEVVYLDLSPASRAIAEARAKVRGLANLSFLTGRLEQVAALAPGPFDYIDCCGVLHHLPDPAEGLKALTAALKPDGGIGLMLYGHFGRSGVYEMQALLRDLVGTAPLKEQVAVARRLLPKLPETNRLRRNPFLADHKQSDAALVDLLLNRRDRAFSVGEILELLEGAGLHPACFLPAAIYRPETYLADPELVRRFQALDAPQRLQAAESLAGNMKTHVLYARPSPEDTEATLDDAAVPLLTKNGGPELARAVQQDLTIKATIEGFQIRRRLPRLAPALLSRIDGVRTVAAIRQDLQAANPAVDDARFEAEIGETYAVLRSLNLIVLRRP